MSNSVRVSHRESAQIEVLRALCITMMMWVHVSPGLSNPSVVSTGDLAWVGGFLGDFMGRASVSVLGFVSGYLIWTGALRLPFLSFVNRQFRTIFLPMAIWVEIFMLLLLAKLFLTAEMPNTLLAVSHSPLGIINQIVGLTVPTANLSLFFLRDLLAASLVLWLLRPAIARWPLTVLVAVTVWSMVLPTAPVIFRPMILVFFTAGAVMARMGGRIDMLSRPAVAVPAAIAAFCAYWMIRQVPTGMGLNTIELAAVMKRTSVSFMMLWVSRQAVLRFDPAPLVRNGKYMFLCYLGHMPAIGLMWAVWNRVIGGPGDASYLAFYLLAPFASVGLGILSGRLLDRAPSDVQRMLRGKVFGGGTPMAIPTPAPVAATLSSRAGGGR